MTARAQRYKAPEINPDELALVDWWRRLSPSERESLKGKVQECRHPIGPMALEELARDFARDLSNRGKAVNTVKIYSRAVAKFSEFLTLSEQDVTDLGVVLVGEFLQSIASEGYNPKTVQSFLDGLKQFTRYLRQQGILGIAQVPKPQAFVTNVPKELPTHLTNEEVERLLAIPDSRTPYGARDLALMEVLFGAGLRVSEALGLDLEDIDLEGLKLFVRHGKGDKQRVGFFGKPCRLALQQYLRYARPQLLDGLESPALFVNNRGGRLSRVWAANIVRVAAKEAGLEKRTTPHTLRHSYATSMMESGAGIRHIQELLGHSSITTTQVYTHVTQQEARKALREHHPRAS